MASITLAIVYALREEIKPILKGLQVLRTILQKKTVFCEASFRETPVLLCQTGMGPAQAKEATERFLELFHPTLILSTGYAGGADPALQTGDLIVPSEIRSEENTEAWAPDPLWREKIEMLIREEELPYRSGLLTTIGRVAGRQEKEERGKGRGLAVDMETAAVAAVALQHRLPFISLRVIFDPAVEEPPRKNVSSLLKLPAFYRRNRICQKNLARVLARFIDSYGR